jgi:molybdopterin-biosynthesis enzyme MoeA-like protein
MRQQYDYVFTSGGIGATHDDITTQTVADAFGARIVEHADALAALVAYYPADQLNATRCKMALMPEGVKLIINPVSAAPGFQLGNVFVLAGVPIIFKAMLEDVLPRLEAGTPIYQHITTLLREGDVAAPLADIQERFLAVQIGSYPHFSKENPHTSLVLRSRDEPLLGQALLAVQKILEEKL